MGRNLDRRVESLVRIDKKEHQHRLQEIIDLGLSAEASSWQLTGTDWVRKSKNTQGQALLDVHAALIHEYSMGR
jgi:polyphosphate kinase